VASDDDDADVARAPDLSVPNEEGSVNEWNEREGSNIAYIRDQAHLLRTKLKPGRAPRCAQAAGWEVKYSGLDTLQPG
jgi:hypothetical protein